MIAGGYDVALSTAYVPEQGWLKDLPIINFARWLNPKAWRDVFVPTYFEATKYLLDLMEEQVKSHNDKVATRKRKVSVATSAADLRDSLAKDELCIIHAIEGAHSLQGVIGGKDINDAILSTDEEIQDEMLGNLEYFFSRGVASLVVAHFYPNHAVQPVFPYPEYALPFAKNDQIIGKWDHTRGLTRTGEAVIERMLELGMVIDVTHCTPAARSRIYQLVEHHKKKNCVIASHMGVYSVNPDPYCLQDWEIKWIADHGGVCGIIFMNYWLSPVDTKFGIKYLMQTVKHLHEVGGAGVVGIGTDFDGFTDPPDEIADASDLPRFTRELASEFLDSERRYPDEVIEKFLGGNALRVLLEGWKKT
jgi:microsomal dipeptidase-like Zn-dependent dipeptidase